MTVSADLDDCCVGKRGANDGAGGVIAAGIFDWDARFADALRRYAAVEVFTPGWFDALADGLRQWAAMVPQVAHDEMGKHLPANVWGLGPELMALRALAANLVIAGRNDIRAHVELLARKLENACRDLDELYPKTMASHDAAERRLTAIVRSQADLLAAYLNSLTRELFGNRFGDAPTTCTVVHQPPTMVASAATGPKQAPRRRSNRATDIEQLKRELVEHIRSARDYAMAQIDAGKPAAILPRPAKSELGRRVGIKPYRVTRAFGDRLATELQLLWRMADDIEQVMRFGR